VRIDPAARAYILDLEFAVADAVIRLKQLKKRRAETVLAELTDPATQTALESARDEAERAMREAEAVATQARMALAQASGTLKDRQRETLRWQDEKARAEGAIRSAQSVRAKEQAQRDELAPFLPTSAPDRAVARAS
jgi:hypothetical protein